jgi:ferrous iron transport protein A
MFKRLTELKTGSSGIIRAFENQEISIKLMEMGCLPGEIITIEQVAPLNDPISVYISGYRLSLRIEEAEIIVVEEVI